MNNLFETEPEIQPQSRRARARAKASKALKTTNKLYRKIPRKPRIILTIVVVTLFLLFLLVVFKPQADKRPIPETVVIVDVIKAERKDYPIIVDANGTVQADTRGDLVAQVRGEIVNVSNQFKTGGSFKKGDVLVEIDARDYQADLSRALAGLSKAQANYSQEKANAKQAEADWKRLGNTEPAPALVLRKPQLAAAKAEYNSAQANHETAKLNLERTKITAPYSGRVIRRDAVLGQYVGVGTVLAEIFSIDGVEVRLPLSQSEYSQLSLDEIDLSKENYDVTLASSIGSTAYEWQAKITRTDSTFNLNTRQIDVIASVIDPFSLNKNQPPLKIGQFVNATIHGRDIKDTIVVPNKTVREGQYVFVIKEGVLHKAFVDIYWQDSNNALIKSGLNEGSLVVTTSINSTLSGTKAKLSKASKTLMNRLPVVNKKAGAEPGIEETLEQKNLGTETITQPQAITED